MNRGEKKSIAKKKAEDRQIRDKFLFYIQVEQFCVATTLSHVSFSSDEGTISSTLLYWVVAACSVVRWWTGCVVGEPAGLVPGTVRSLSGHPRGGSVQPRSFPPACLQEMQDKGGARAEARKRETGEDKGGKGGHCGGVEVPRLSLEHKDEVWSSEECQAGVFIVAASCFAALYYRNM